MSKISVIMPIYNCEKYLDQSISSVLNQTYKKLELILINDGSTDGSLDICKKYEQQDSRVRLISKRNEGVSASRNEGLRICTGEYITFIDADDYIDICMYECMIKQFENSTIDFVLCDYIEVDEEGKHREISNNTTGIFNRDYFLNRIYYKVNITFNVWNVVFKRNVIKDLKFDLNISLGEDNLFVLRVLQKCSKGMMIDKCLYYYVQHKDSAFHQIRVTETVMSSLIADKKQLQILKEENKKMYNYCRHILIRDAVNISKRIIVNNQKNKRWERYIRKVIWKELLTGVWLNVTLPKGILKNAIIIALSFKIYTKMYKKHLEVKGNCPKR